MKYSLINRRSNTRKGVAAVEFALVAPLFLMLIFGIIEFGRALMVKQVLVNASREGARHAVLDGSTSARVVDLVSDYLQTAKIAVPRERIKVSPDPTGVTDNGQITVTVSVSFAEASWLPPFFYHGDLQASTTMRSERM